MHLQRENRTNLRGRRWLIPLLLIGLTLACAIPGMGEPSTEIAPLQDLQEDSPVVSENTTEPTLPPAPTPTPMPLPPAVVEIDPPLGSDFPLQGPLTLYFNQPMDRPSVEMALSGEPQLSGRFNWIDDTTMAFEPDSAYPTESDLSIKLDTTALATNGQFLQSPVQLNYKTVSPLKAVQVIPEPNLLDADPVSAVIVTFNQPVVPLGADPSTLVEAFTIDPGAPGRGEWVNTSTYAFYPDPPLAGGENYIVLLNPNLKSTSGGPFVGRATTNGTSNQWTFRTAPPRVNKIYPGDGAGAVRLDTLFQVEFSQPMDSGSVEENFSVYEAARDSISGEFGWNNDFTILTFTPTISLKRNTSYLISLLGTSKTQGNTPLGVDYSASVRTVPALEVQATEPLNGGTKRQRSNLRVYFNSPVKTADFLDYVTISPAVANLSHWWDENALTVSITGDFEPLAAYTVTLAADLPDPWGGTLGDAYTFQFATAALEASIFIAHGESQLFITPQETSITAQATHIDKVGIRLGSIPFRDLVEMLSPGGYDTLQNYLPTDQLNWTQNVALPGDQLYTVQLGVTPDGENTLAPGIYHLSYLVPELAYQLPPYILVSSNIQLTFKLSPTQAFVWAVDLRTNQPVGNTVVTIYDQENTVLASGSTNANGVFETDIPTQTDIYGTYYAVMGEPGEDNFSLVLSSWNQGIQSYDFGFWSDFSGPTLTNYIYTDRPIYRPGQTVYFRGILRYEENGRYQLPELETVPVTVYDGDYNPITTLELTVSEFGTVHGEYTLFKDAQPGYYKIGTEWGAVDFQVAEYRKPEINLQVQSEDAVSVGDSITAQVEARYFFDAPAGNAHLSWNVYKSPRHFEIPGYRVGIDNFRWLGPAIPDYSSLFGELVTSGEANTNAEGLLTLEFATDPEDESLYRYTIEVTLVDESGFPVSARAETMVHPNEFYAGIRPDTWVGKAGTEIGYEVFAAAWDKKSAGVQELVAQFQKVTWVREESQNPFFYPTFTPQYTPVSRADFRTAPDGVARLAFIPPEAGTYVLDVSGGNTHSQALVWVGGTGQAVWPNLPNQQLRLTADKESYQPGDTASIFIPNPFDDPVQALITIERGKVMRYETLTLDGSGSNYELPLTAEDAPNIYISVALIGQRASGAYDFRQGYLNLTVEPTAQTLNVEITAQPERAGPRDKITFEIRVTDNDGTPVQGEFSLAVVDLAALALADPNAVDILPAFYDEQPLGVRTGMSLVVYAQRRTNVLGGLGGGGDEDQNFIIREDFPDTAYWNAKIVTDADGKAQVTLTLPDNLTTWEIDVRGLTTETQVGQSRLKVTTTKDLLIRPVTSRFAVVGDHMQMAAVVHNNTNLDLDVEVNLQSSGFLLDDSNLRFQNVSIPAGGRTRVAWWGTVQDVDLLDLVFAANAGDLSDITRPTTGDIPVLRFLAPQTFGTAGILDLEGERLEVISLPKTFDPSGGTLTVELAPSLAAAMTAGLDVLEYSPYAGTEQTLSRFLPNLMAFRSIQDLGLDSPDLLSRLERTLDTGITELTAGQNEDGGWGWWSGGESDDQISAYVVFGLNQAKQAGAFVDDAVIENGANYLLETLPSLELLSSTWQLDRMAFHYFALSQTNFGSAGQARNLFEIRSNLSPYAHAFLALALETYDPTDERIATLLSEIESSAVRTATGIHWEGQDVKRNMETPVFNTAVVVYAIAKQDPASIILPEAVRYIMSARGADGSWGTTYETAWSIMALTEVMKGTGELAGDFGFSASLNGRPLLDGQADGDARLTPVEASIPVNDLYPNDPNGLSLSRTGGPGRLYYSAHLNVMRPAEDVAPLNRGIGVERIYADADDDTMTTKTDFSSLAGNVVTVRIALTLENDSYYLVVEDYIPAGAEILDSSLKTNQQGLKSVDMQTPFVEGWGWWLFNTPKIYDDHITWAADYLPAGTYELTYTLVLTHPGEFQVLPAQAWEFYFPEVQGNSAGSLFVIEE